MIEYYRIYMKNYIFKKSQTTLPVIISVWLFISSIQISQAQYTPWANISSGSLTSNLPSWSISLDRSTSADTPTAIEFASSGVLRYERRGQTNRFDTIYTQLFNFLSGNVPGLQDIQYDFTTTISTTTGSSVQLLLFQNNQYVSTINSTVISTGTSSVSAGPNNLTTSGYYRLAIVINFSRNIGNNIVNLDFSGFTTPQSLLPAQGCSFHATSLARGIQLTWQNKDQFQNSFFEIERGLEEFEMIGKVSGLALTDASKEFLFIDKNPMYGLNLYRLKIIDADGSYSYSQVLSTYFFDIQSESDITLYPNPSSEQITISGVEAKTVKIYTLSGTKICELPVNSVLNIDFLENGNYILHIESTDGRITKHRFLKE